MSSPSLLITVAALSVFQWILSLGIIPLVDLFATLEKHYLPTCISPVQDLSACAADAFQVDWNYLFPIVSLILMVLGCLSF